MTAGEQYYINTVVRPGFLGIPPVFVGGALPQGSTGATIYFGSAANWLSTDLVHVTGFPYDSANPDPSTYDVPLDSYALAVLIHPTLQTTARVMTNPCAIAAFYGGSAAAGATATVSPTEVIAAAETAGIRATAGVAAGYRWGSNANAAVTIGRTLDKVAKASQGFCTWLGKANW